MLVLALDTSSPSGSVAALRDGQLLAVISTRTEEDYSSRMFRHLEWLLRELSLDLAQFDVFAVTSGPGSFTGLRVGLSAVKGWAEAYGRPIVAVSALEAVAAQSRMSSGLLVPVLDARRGEVYCGFYHPGEVEASSPSAVDQPRVLSPREFVAAMAARADQQELVVVTPTPEVLARDLHEVNVSRSGQRRLRVEMVSNVLAPVVGTLGWRRALEGKTDNALTLDADYVRRTDAELKWKDRGLEDSCL